MKKAILLTILLASLALAQDFTFSGIENPSTVGQKYTITITATEGTGEANLRLVVGGNPFEYVVPNTVDFNGTTTWTGDVEFTIAATNVQLRCVDPDDGDAGDSDPFDIDPGTAAKWQIIAPGQTVAPGTATGKTGSAVVTAGGDSTYTINICDKWYNVITSASGTPGLASNDTFGILPTSPIVGDNTIQLRTVEGFSGSQTHTVTVSGGSYANDVSNVKVNVGNATQLLLICDGEKHLPGDTTSVLSNLPGKMDDPERASGIVGEAYDVKIYAVDECWNVVPSYNSTGEVDVYSGTENLTAGSVDNIVSGRDEQVPVEFTADDPTNGIPISANDGNITSYSTRVIVYPGVHHVVAELTPDTVPVGVHSTLDVTVYNGPETTIGAGVAVTVTLIDGLATYFHILDDSPETNSDGIASTQIWADTAGIFTVEAKAGDKTDTVTLVVQERPGITVIPNPYKYSVHGDIPVKFSYKVAEGGAAEIVLLIADMYGNVVYKTTYEKGAPETDAGTQEISWDRTNSKGNRVASGMYQAVMKITLTNLSTTTSKKNFMVIW